MQLRQVTNLLKDIQIIGMECGGRGRGVYGDESKLDEFQRYKLDLNEMLVKIKGDIKTQKGLENRVGTSTESIKLKRRIKNNLKEAKRLCAKLEAAYDENQRDLDNGETFLSEEEVASRQELVSLMSQDLEYTQNEFEPKTTRSPELSGHTFNLAKTARENRKKKIDQGLISSEPQPLTSKQQQFIQESIQRDIDLDNKLIAIKQGVMVLGQIANDINNELEVQDVMLDEVEHKMENVTDKLETRNGEIKRLLESSGGASRWCPALILCVILMACIGYVYNAFLAK